MAHITTTENRKQAPLLIVGCVFLFAGFGALVYSRFATSVGVVGLYNRASLGIGFILFGISMAIFTPCLYLQTIHKKHVDQRELARELTGIALGFFCYVLPFLFGMGALSSADTTGLFGIALTVAFLAIPFFYRRHRKRNPISYTHTGAVAMVLFCAVMAGIAIVGGSFSSSEVLEDLDGGWKQERFAFYEANINKPSGRGALLTPTTFEVALYKDGYSVKNRTADAHLSVNASDWPAVAPVLDEPMAEVRWYPETRTLVGARDVDGPLAAGDSLE